MDFTRLYTQPATLGISKQNYNKNILFSKLIVSCKHIEIYNIIIKDVCNA